jgi:hypothetical protein
VRRRPAIPLLDAPALRSRARRTLLLRAGLAAVLVAALVTAYLLARQPRRELGLVPGGTSPVVVLDLSWSVSSDSYTQIASTLRRLADSRRRLGLVLFSDVAYEALPPGTRASELRPFARFFETSGKRQGKRLGETPWSEAFSGGTRIWAALELARRMLHRDRIRHGSVVLISDLADAPNDRALLAQTMVSYVRDNIPIRVVALNPTPEDERLFQVTLAGGGSVVRARSAPGGSHPLHSRAAFPLGLAVAAGFLLLLLAVNEHALGSLAWRRGTA